MTSSNTLDKHSHCPTILLFFILWLVVTTFIWLVNISGIAFSADDFQFPIQQAMVSFLHAVLKDIFDLFRALQWPHI